MGFRAHGILQCGQPPGPKDLGTTSTSKDPCPRSRRTHPRSRSNAATAAVRRYPGGSCRPSSTADAATCRHAHAWIQGPSSTSPVIHRQPPSVLSSLPAPDGHGQGSRTFWPAPHSPQVRSTTQLLGPGTLTPALSSWRRPGPTVICLPSLSGADEERSRMTVSGVRVRGRPGLRGLREDWWSGSCLGNGCGLP